MRFLQTMFGSSNSLSRSAKLVEQDRYPEAQALLEKHARMNGACWQTHLLLGVCAKQLGDYRIALDYLSRAAKQLGHGKEMGVILAHRADAFLGLEDLKAAASELNRAAHIDPDCELIYMVRGIYYQRKEKHSKAAVEFQQCLRLDPDSESALGSLCYSLVESGNAAQAEQILLDQIKQHPLRVGYALALANLYRKIHRNDKALVFFDRVLRLDPNHLPALITRATILRYTSNRTVQALVDVNRAIELEPQHQGLYHLRAQIYEELDQLELAIADLNTVVQLDPDVAGSLLLRGELYQRLNHHRAAIEDFRAAINLHEEPLPWVQEGLAYSLLALGQTAEAQDSFDQYCVHIEEEFDEVREAGRLVKAALVQANSKLFLDGPSSLPGYVLFSFERALNEQPELLVEMAGRLYEYKNRSFDREENRFLSNLTTDELAEFHREKLPDEFTGGYTVYASSLMFYRPFLEHRRILAQRIYYCCAEENDPYRIILVPHYRLKKRG